MTNSYALRGQDWKQLKCYKQSSLTLQEVLIYTHLGYYYSTWHNSRSKGGIYHSS